MCTLVYIYVHTHIHMCVHMCVHMNTHAGTCTYTCIHMYTYIHMCTHVRTWAHMCSYMYTCIHMCTLVYTYVRTHVCVCVCCVCTCVHICAHVYTCVHMCACIAVFRFLIIFIILFFRLLRPDFDDVCKQIQDAITKNTRNSSPGLLKLLQDIEKYVRTVPVIGFNSRSYDLLLIKEQLATHSVETANFLQTQKLKKNGNMESSNSDTDLGTDDADYNLKDEVIDFIIKRNQTYTTIVYPRLQFLDVLNYTAPNTSLDRYLKAYDTVLQKGHFPYSWVDCIAKLDYPRLPDQSDFRNDLKNEDISDSDYALCVKAWKDKKMVKFSDYVEHYNSLDTIPLLEAVTKQMKFFETLGIDMLKDGVSLPSLGSKYMFASVKKGIYFSLIGKQDSDYLFKLRENMFGGLSIILTRHHCKNKTKIKGGKLCQHLLGWDCISLYLGCLTKKFPIKHFCR